MSSASKGHSPFARPLLTLFNAGTAVGLSDGELLQRFTSGGDDSAEMAFSVLVERHGAMVLRVCRSVTGDRSEAEDAFQSTFLILARKAGSVRVDETLAPWLYGVARKVSARALASTQRRRRFIERFAEWSRGTTPQPPSDNAAAILIREELARLPHRYQAAVRLCDLDGFTQEEAAQLLKLPLGTIKSRLFRGRSKLREALIRKGFTTNWLCLVSPGVSSITLPPNLATLAVRAALYESQGTLAAGALISSTVIALTEGSMQAMFMTKVKVAVCLVLGAGVVAGGTLSRTGTGVVFGAFQQEAGSEKKASDTSKPQPSVSGSVSPTKDESSALKSQSEQAYDRLFGEFLEDRMRAKSDVDKAVKECYTDLEGKIYSGKPKSEYQQQREKLDQLKKEQKRLEEEIRWMSLLIQVGVESRAKKSVDTSRTQEPKSANPQSNAPPSPPSVVGTILPPTNSSPTDGLPISSGDAGTLAQLSTKLGVPPLESQSGIEHQIALARKKLEAKKGALNRAKAQEALANSVVAINERLNKRIPGSASFEDMEKAKAEVNVAKADIEIAEAEFQASQIELEWLKRLPAGNPPSNPPIPVTPDNVRDAQVRGVIDDLKHQLAVNQSRLAAKKGALTAKKGAFWGAKARYDRANEKLLAANKGTPGVLPPVSFSSPEWEKADSEVKIAQGGLDIAEAELKESQLEVDRIEAMLKKTIAGKPDTSPTSPSKPDQGELQSKMERRISGLESKLDQALELLKLVAPSTSTVK